jgi:hypothetical protein
MPVEAVLALRTLLEAQGLDRPLSGAPRSPVGKAGVAEFRTRLAWSGGRTELAPGGGG